MDLVKLRLRFPGLDRIYPVAGAFVMVAESVVLDCHTRGYGYGKEQSD